MISEHARLQEYLRDVARKGRPVGAKTRPMPAKEGPLWREFLMIGVLGAFTTFSAFALDSVGLWQNGQPLLAALNVGANLVLCLGGTAAAIAVTRLF